MRSLQFCMDPLPLVFIFCPKKNLLPKSSLHKATIRLPGLVHILQIEKQPTHQYILKAYYIRVILSCTNLLHQQALKQSEKFRLTISNYGYTGIRMIPTKIKFALHFWIQTTTNFYKSRLASFRHTTCLRKTRPSHLASIPCMSCKALRIQTCHTFVT